MCNMIGNYIHLLISPLTKWVFKIVTVTQLKRYLILDTTAKKGKRVSDATAQIRK